ncbi:unnamed protein product [Mycena citricolor]|uniref:Uncharacterized protein n=1 Tax=Mycena citricolor TaxID=2018698 RepID=A0AAD2HCQ6_9AGAR|nr:unnamed protein product [Mycena citricolor]
MAGETSYVAFPTSDKNIHPTPRPRPTHLPFRRISFPTSPNPHRASIASVASFDSTPEEGQQSPSSPSSPGILRIARPHRRSNVRSMSTNRWSGKPVDELREAKRRKVIQEFQETERTYVDGLELIYSHFLTPIIQSLETPQPLLQRGELASVFSNFVDIWNLHRAFYAALSDTLSDRDALPPPLSPVLLAHFPYLSLYNPFITSFPTTISAMVSMISPPTAISPNPQYNAVFAVYLQQQEADPRCGKLKLRDWLLTIVQRCPRYLLLLKDLISCTDPDDPEHAQLTAVHKLVSKITLTLNTSIHTHAQTLALLALQRATPNLPFQLISPGRTLVRRGPLAHVERSSAPRDREFLLFSDCLVWLEADEGWTGAGAASSSLSPGPFRPTMVRTRSKSDAELPVIRSAGDLLAATKSALPPLRKSVYRPPIAKRRHGSSGAMGAEETRWVYKGRAELVDLEVVVSPVSGGEGEERRFDVLSPEGSFVLYAECEEERNLWTDAIRQTKAQLFVSLNVTHPDSTLTSSASTAHLRRALQALPFPPSDERLVGRRDDGKTKKGKKKLERREGVEHWVPAIWIPDEKTEGCMRCGRPFGWRRRRHHCRLCGRCVCSTCSERTFFISDPNSKHGSSKPARACNACYETVFPVLEDSDAEEEGQPSMLSANSNTMSSLSNFPSWLSMPSLPLASTTEALMAIDRRQGMKYERLRRGFSVNEALGSAVRSLPSRPRSYHQILDDLTTQVEEEEVDSEDSRSLSRPTTIVDLGDDDVFDEETRPRKENTARRNKRFSMPAVALQTTNVTTRTQLVSISDGPAKMPTRSKRFSLVLGTRPHVQHAGYGSRGQSEMVGRQVMAAQDELGRGAAAGKLSELLGRHNRSQAQL